MTSFLGTDILYIPRLAEPAGQFGERYFLKMLSADELKVCMQRSPHLPLSHPQVLSRLAARIATKEAVAKALKTGLNGLGWGEGIDWYEIQITSIEKQAPSIVLVGKAQEVAQSLGITQWAISWSHDGDYATATVIGN